MNTVRLSLRRILVVTSVLALALLTASVAFAQTGSSSLRGTVTDLQKRAVAGAPPLVHGLLHAGPPLPEGGVAGLSGGPFPVADPEAGAPGRESQRDSDR